MPKFSVKKPFTVLVGVILALVLGLVSLSKMSTDLLPTINLPYLMVVAPYPGASPEQVESSLTAPLEAALGTINGVENVTSTSSENFGMVMLEFAEDTDMDSAMVKATTKLNQLADQLPERASTPTITEITADMMATEYLAVDYSGMDIFQLSEYVESTVIPAIERINGVARVSSVGLVKQTVEVSLNQEKIQKINDKLLAQVSQRLKEAMDELDKAQAQLYKGQAEIKSGKQKLKEGQEELEYRQEELSSQLRDMLDAVNDKIQDIQDKIDQLQDYISQFPEEYGLQEDLEELAKKLEELWAYRDELEQVLEELELHPLDPELGDAAAQLLFSGLQAQLAVGQLQVTTGEAQLKAGQTQLDAAKKEYEAARDEALRSANLDQLLNMQALAQIIGAQNFSMPAGYIADEQGEKFLLKVGDNYESVEELEGALLVTMDGIGDVRLSDVADVSVVDNSQDAYAKVNGNQAVLMSIYKGSTASTSDVSDACNEKAAQMMEEDGNLRLTPIMDQGEYIRLIVSTVTKNLFMGAALAVIVLIFFLKDVRPTLVVAISIPLSVLVALVAMYFSGISINIISLSGLGLGIGMLVDNSIVVIENIYRLRNHDIPPARAAVQGTRQVAGSIISSTITTICVFLPMLFTTGLVRQLMMDLALTITFALLASLVVAMTVVPCAGSTVLKKTSAKKHLWFDKMLVAYDKSLRWCLQHKALPLILAVALVVGCVWQLGRMGMVLLPQISSNQMTMTVSLPEDTQKQAAYQVADQVMDAVLQVPGVETIGAMSSDSANELMAGAAGMSMGGGSSTSAVTGFSYFLVLDEEGGKDQEAVRSAILDSTKDLPCTVSVDGSSMADASALLGSGMEVDIYGQNLDVLLDLSHQVMDILDSVEGIENISNGQEAGDTVISLVVNKDEAMRLGLTVAQVYSQLAQTLTTDAVSTTLTVTDGSYQVNIVDTTKTPTLENILDFAFETETVDQDGQMVRSTHTLGEFATQTEGKGVASINRENLSRLMQVTSSTAQGYNTSILARQVQQKLDALTVPDGYTVEIAGETTQVTEMITQMGSMMLLALLLIYLVMVAQFQSLLSPFIVLFTIPLAFTGGFLAMILTREEISLVSLMGFLILMGVVVNNGIVFVDYANQLRLGGLSRREALVATGKTRMRPILMTTLTTILSMITMLFSSDPGSEMGHGMAVVIVGGLLYATVMTLYIVPVMYDILFKRNPVNIDVGDEGLDDLPDDAAEFLAQGAGQ